MHFLRRLVLLSLGLLCSTPAMASPLFAEVSPAHPVVGQEISLRAVYGFSDTCWIIDEIDKGWEEDVYRLDLLSHRDPLGVCLTVLWEYEETIPLGQLSAGIYRVQIQERFQGVCDQPGTPPCEEILEVEFEVFSAVVQEEESWGTLKARH